VQHTYWNLAGHDSGKDILDHLVRFLPRRNICKCSNGLGVGCPWVTIEASPSVRLL